MTNRMHYEDIAKQARTLRTAALSQTGRRQQNAQVQAKSTMPKQPVAGKINGARTLPVAHAKSDRKAQSVDLENDTEVDADHSTQNDGDNSHEDLPSADTEQNTSNEENNQPEEPNSQNDNNDNEELQEQADEGQESTSVTHEEAEVEPEPPALPPSIEREQLKEAITMIEYKLIEINALMKECIEQEFSTDVMSDSQTLMLSCTGLTYQIMFHNFKEGMRRLKIIFLDLLKQKMKSLDDEYDDEIDFFLDVLEEFIDKDYKLTESLEISKKNVKYYVSPRFYESLLEIAEPEIRAINAIHARLKVSRKEVQDLIVKKMIERENYLRKLDKEMVAKPEEEEVESSHDATYTTDEDNEENSLDPGDEEYQDEDEGDMGYEGEGDEEDNGSDNQYDDQGGYEGDNDNSDGQNQENHDTEYDERQPDERDGPVEGPEFDDMNTGEGN